MKYIYEKITNLIIEKLENNIIPWQKTWTTSAPRNFVSGIEYKGINILLLGMQDFESNYWLSFKQCKDLGGSVKKDEKSTMVVFWKPIIKSNDNKSIDETTADVIFLLRYYNIFNIEQCNLPDEVLEKRNTNNTNNEKIIKAEEVIKHYKYPPRIVINNVIPNPRYLPRIDQIEIQSINNFRDSDSFYASLYHELVHSTGAKNRIARKGIVDPIEFGSDNYSKEELIAEIGASFLCSITGIPKTIDNQSAYIQNWLRVLKNDNRMVLIASSQAQKACDYILNIQLTNQKEVE